MQEVPGDSVRAASWDWTRDGLIRLYLLLSHSISSLLPIPDAPKTRAFISWAKYPRSPQSLSLLALRQSDNYLVSFPLLLASREVF